MNLSEILKSPNDDQLSPPDALVRTIIEKLQTNNTGAVCVVSEEQTLLGIITDGDIRRIFHNSENATLTTIFSKQAKSIIRPNTLTIGKESTLKNALTLMVNKNIGALPVTTADNKLISIVSEKQILRHFLTEMQS